MFSPGDTIVAIATPPGRGGLGVVRISGPQAPDIARSLLDRNDPLAPRHATFARVRDGATPSRSHALDHVVVTWFPEPHSYTGQHVVEVSAHGSPVVLQTIVRGAIAAGARLATPGEFTLRAFLNGKLDLVQAEAVADLIAAATPLQARVAFDQLEGTLTRRIAEIDEQLFDLIARLEASLDFPDEGYHFIEPGEVSRGIDEVARRVRELLADSRRGRMIREGVSVVLSGRTNVGKSSIFNYLAGSERAIVTAIPGTTRDLVTERVDLDGLAVTVVDTAGARETTDIVEREGVNRSTQARGVADLVLLVLDSSEPLTDDDRWLLEQTSTVPRLVVANKSDMPQAFEITDALRVSAITGEGIDALRAAMRAALTGEESLRESAAISNVRHASLLEDALGLLERARDSAAHANTPEEFLLVDLHAARACLEEVVGRRTSDDLLRRIFERFCIGK